MRLILVVVFSLVSLLAVAQPPPDGGGNGDPTPTNPTVPISGVEILLLAGGALGLRSLLSKKDKSKH